MTDRKSNGILTTIAVGLVGAILGFGAGVTQDSIETPLPGTFVQFGGGAVIIDTRTGYLCDAFPGPATFLPPCPQTKKFVEDSRPAPAAPVQQ